MDRFHKLRHYNIPQATTELAADASMQGHPVLLPWCQNVADRLAEAQANARLALTAFNGLQAKVDAMGHRLTALTLLVQSAEPPEEGHYET